MDLRDALFAFSLVIAIKYGQKGLLDPLISGFRPLRVLLEEGSKVTKM